MLLRVPVLSHHDGKRGAAARRIGGRRRADGWSWANVGGFGGVAVGGVGGLGDGRRVRVAELQDFGEAFHHLAHLGPAFRLPHDALAGEHAELLSRFGWEPELELGVDSELQFVGISHVGLHPLLQPLLIPGPVAVQGSPTSEHLQHHHSEAVHVALGRQVASLDVLRSCVPLCALHLSKIQPKQKKNK